MLVLSRKPDEQIVLDGCITITVLRVQGNRVRLGIEAPDGVSIKRQEIEVELDDVAERDEARAAIEQDGKPQGRLVDHAQR